MECIAQDQGVVQRSAIVRTFSSCKGGETLTCRRIRGECNDTCSHIDATSFYILDIFDKSSALLQSAKTPYNIGGWCQDGMTMNFRVFPNVLQVAEQRDARERRSVATLEDFALSCSMQLHNSAFRPWSTRSLSCHCRLAKTTLVVATGCLRLSIRTKWPRWKYDIARSI